MKKRFHQFIIGATPGDAITDQARLLQQWLQEDGFDSEIYAESIHPELNHVIRHYYEYHPSQRNEVVILHHSIGADLVQYLLKQEVHFLLIYHNITPSSFFQFMDPLLAAQVRRGRKQLRQLSKHTLLALADSPFNEAELRDAGYARTDVLPIVFDPSRYNLSSNAVLIDRYKDDKFNLLFVGRLTPNKRQEDLIKLLYCYRQRINPSTRLLLVGSPWMPAYAEWLRELTEELDLQDSVIFAGHVSQQDLVTYYRLADLYISLSEHEGFGKPLIESMYFEIPIIAYAAAAIPSTLGGTGILLRAKHYEAIAELIEILRLDQDLRTRIVEGQRQRLQDFLEPRVHQQWQKLLTAIQE